MSKEIKLSVQAILADINDRAAQAFADDNAVKKVPSLIVVDNHNTKRRFLCTEKIGNLTKKSILGCVDRYEKNTLERLYRSEQLEQINPALLNPAWNYLTGEDYSGLFSKFKNSYNLVYFFNKTLEAEVEVFKRLAVSISSQGKVKKLTFNIFNTDLNENEHTQYVKPGTLLLYSPNQIKVPELKPKKLTGSVIMEFLEDHAPGNIYKQILEARNSVLDEIDL